MTDLMTCLDLAKAPVAAQTFMPPSFTTTLRISSLDAVRRLGATLASELKAGDVVLLNGDLGAGKTELARAVIQAGMASAIEVPSPTFTLVQTYELPGLKVAHADLYRVEGLSELAELGLDEAMDEGAILVEWPDRGNGLWPESRLEIALSIDGQGPARTVQLTGHGAWAVRMAKMKWDLV